LTKLETRLKASAAQLYDECMNERAKLQAQERDHEAFCKQKNDDHNSRFSQKEKLAYIDQQKREWQRRIDSGKSDIDRQIRALQNEKSGL